jgi:hypothetical protein
MHPIATAPPASTSQQVQNQKDESLKEPTTAMKIAMMIPQIIFGILLIFLIGVFWHVTFNYESKE